MKVKSANFLAALFLGIMALLPLQSVAQDSIPPFPEVDTTKVDTIVIRAQQYKIKIIPRGVNLTVPKLTFTGTKPLIRRKKKFRVPSFWTRENEFTLNLSEVAFVNWNAGGDNSVSALGGLKFERNYKFRYFQWDNSLVIRYGVNAQEGRQLRKTDDAIRLSSTIGYRKDTLNYWFYSVKANFNTQISNGFKYPDRSTPISRFMAPGYLFFGAGTSYIPEGKGFNLYLSPTSLKATFVLDQDLANDGAFGVKKAIRDDAGNIITPGENTFIEFGILINNTWKKEIGKNMVLDHRLNLYTDYLRSFGNVDIDWELNLNLKVNEYIKANIGTQIIYDDDILFNEVKADDGSIVDPGQPRIQFRQLLGVGLAYNF
ncbi:DUF3078 domain-containing protein [Lentiprolixibacter aurantiacus]|uniref:DUF3078 domain-containing protein n=1 Tax=Lentiprolixibacter aurantiacus TaxID=2993939 RepID=A0AAE3SMH9_9FLAO|nr:DUF3078 domain-containing protein [Lentiprolixibacter aurantiacus]MCX2718722.1 DUF3078 domain-containing protein [Lentiprolixibacter aurantiacus]